MARRKHSYPSLRTRLEGLIRRIDEKTAFAEREQVFLDWYLENQDNDRFGLAKEIIISMLNGEFGPQVQDAVRRGNTQEAIDAARDLISDFVITG